MKTTNLIVWYCVGKIKITRPSHHSIWHEVIFIILTTNVSYGRRQLVSHGCPIVSMIPTNTNSRFMSSSSVMSATKYREFLQYLMRAKNSESGLLWPKTKNIISFLVKQCISNTFQNVHYLDHTHGLEEYAIMTFLWPNLRIFYLSITIFKKEIKLINWRPNFVVSTIMPTHWHQSQHAACTASLLSCKEESHLTATENKNQKQSQTRNFYEHCNYTWTVISIK